MVGLGPAAQLALVSEVIVPLGVGVLLVWVGAELFLVVGLEGFASLFWGIGFDLDSAIFEVYDPLEERLIGASLL